MQLDEGAVRELLSLEALIPAMEEALVALSAGRVEQPVRVLLPVAEAGGFLGVMPASAPEIGLGAKIVTFYPNNEGVPTHHATVLLFRPETGEPLAVMDGRLITELRTGAVSAVATQYLARPEAATLAILGSGVQARSHLEALRLVRPFREVRVWSPRHARAFAEEHGVTAAASAEDAVRGADVVVVATTARTPVLHGEWLAPGTHVNAIGGVPADQRELDDALLRRARIVVESRAAVLRESGDVIAAGRVDAELGEVIAGTQPGRTSADELTLFKSVGVAVEDIAAAALVYRSASAATPAPAPR